MVQFVKNPPASAGDVRDMGSSPKAGRSSGGGHGNPLQYSCLVNPMDRGAWWATVHGVTESDITETTQHGSSQGQEKVKLTIHHHTVKNHTSRTKATVSVDFIFLCSNHSKFHDVLLIHMNTHE